MAGGPYLRLVANKEQDTSETNARYPLRWYPAPNYKIKMLVNFYFLIILKQGTVQILSLKNRLEFLQKHQMNYSGEPILGDFPAGWQFSRTE